jgi:hypothetical protein
MDIDASRSYAEDLMQVSAKYDLSAMHAVGSFMSGAARGLEGDVPAGLKQMEAAFDATLAYGFLGVLPGVIFADMLARAGRTREALAQATRLLDDLTTETAVFVPELWRLRGELVLREDAGDTDRALRDFQTALRIAQVQGAPIYQLRAATGAARLLAEIGQRDRACQVLDQACMAVVSEWAGPESDIARQLRSQLA